MDSEDRVQREEMLRRGVLAGDERAWQIWYDQAFGDLYNYVRWRCGGRREWADEIVQETWLTAVRRVRRFEPRQGSFLTWLRGIAANLLRNELRRRRRSPKFERSSNGEVAGDDNAARQRDQGHRQERIAAALDALSDREEAVLRAKYLEGLTVAEIAARGSETPKAVESLLTRAREAFRNVYREGDEHADT